MEVACVHAKGPAVRCISKPSSKIIGENSLPSPLSLFTCSYQIGGRNNLLLSVIHKQTKSVPRFPTSFLYSLNPHLYKSDPQYKHKPYTQKLQQRNRRKPNTTFSQPTPHTSTILPLRKPETLVRGPGSWSI
jgi:hypothetical protein